ncbi:hypothetical protein LZ32DRAFT_98453 [Colletotrichum eremochloae]|nr:hypothetical protein LZ32DRAFT_98453 [Colletotrichum eremochloae]
MTSLCRLIARHSFKAEPIKVAGFWRHVPMATTVAHVFSRARLLILSFLSAPFLVQDASRWFRFRQCPRVDCFGRDASAKTTAARTVSSAMRRGWPSLADPARLRSILPSVAGWQSKDETVLAYSSSVGDISL